MVYLLLIFVFLQLSFEDLCKCSTGNVCCYAGNCHFYTGGENTCLCWINRDSWSQQFSRISFLHHSSSDYNPGECYWCGINQFRRSEDSKEPSFNATAFNDQERHFKKLVSIETKVEKTEYAPLIKKSYQYCPYDPHCDCNYFGTYEACISQCKGWNDKYHWIYGTMHILWTDPHGFCGSCSCNGMVDPCVLHDY